MTNFDLFIELLNHYLDQFETQPIRIFNLHEASRTDENPQNYMYNGEKELSVVDMDFMAKTGYKTAKGVEGLDNIVNTADAFVINQNNDWFFVEFKDTEVKAKKADLKNSVLKKAYANWFMLLDILFYMNGCGENYSGFRYDQPIEFAQQHVYYILVCSKSKNPHMYGKIKDSHLAHRQYTPPFMQRLKDYIFKDAYAYTEDLLEQKFVKTFKY